MILYCRWCMDGDGGGDAMGMVEEMQWGGGGHVVRLSVTG